MDINVRVGDGNLALFWKDRWNGADSPCAIAPELSTLVRPRAMSSFAFFFGKFCSIWVIP
jgi:hypothetical protein